MIGETTTGTGSHWKPKLRGTGDRRTTTWLQRDKDQVNGQLRKGGSRLLLIRPLKVKSADRILRLNFEW